MVEMSTTKGPSKDILADPTVQPGGGGQDLTDLVTRLFQQAANRSRARAGSPVSDAVSAQAADANLGAVAGILRGLPYETTDVQMGESPDAPTGTAPTGMKPDSEGASAVAFDVGQFAGVTPGRDGVPAGLQPNAARGAAAVRTVFGFNGAIGGVGGRPNNPSSDHPHGRAIDVMTLDNQDLGWDIARWFVENAASLGATYVIFNGQIASARHGWEWRPYRHPSGRSNPTLDHDDHVHISFAGGG